MTHHQNKKQLTVPLFALSLFALVITSVAVGIGLSYLFRESSPVENGLSFGLWFSLVVVVLAALSRYLSRPAVTLVLLVLGALVIATGVAVIALTDNDDHRLAAAIVVVLAVVSVVGHLVDMIKVRPQFRESSL